MLEQNFFRSVRLNSTHNYKKWSLASLHLWVEYVKPCVNSVFFPFCIPREIYVYVTLIYTIFILEKLAETTLSYVPLLIFSSLIIMNYSCSQCFCRNLFFMCLSKYHTSRLFLDNGNFVTWNLQMWLELRVIRSHKKTDTHVKRNLFQQFCLSSHVNISIKLFSIVWIHSTYVLWWVFE